jgi:cytidine deaminase
MTQEIPWERMFAAADKAKENAWAPYSKFRVGAAVLTPEGEIFSGCNVENSSYGLALCAERNAIARAVGEGARKIAAVVVVADTDKPCPPCGACRQVIAEFASPEAPIRSRTPQGQVDRYTLSELLPFAFTGEFL